MPNKFIVGIDPGDKEHDCSISISEKNSDGSLTLLSSISGKDAAHIYALLIAMYRRPGFVQMVIEKK